MQSVLRGSGTTARFSIRLEWSNAQEYCLLLKLCNNRASEELPLAQCLEVTSLEVTTGSAQRIICVANIELRPAACKASTLLIVLSLLPYNFIKTNTVATMTSEVAPGSKKYSKGSGICLASTTLVSFSSPHIPGHLGTAGSDLQAQSQTGVKPWAQQNVNQSSWGLGGGDTQKWHHYKNIIIWHIVLRVSPKGL